MQLEVFNSVDRADAIDVLRPCLDIQRWVEHIADARPFSSLDSLLGFARETAEPFTSDEVAAAMAHHPRIGERPKAQTTEAAMSRSEQAGVDPSDDGVVTALAEGNREYEAKFGRVFLIRAAGRTAGEILASLQERLTHTAEEEDIIVAGQLREIALLRIAGVISESSAISEGAQQMSVSQITTHILDTGSGRPAAGVAVVLSVRDGDNWRRVASGTTDADGRIKDLGPERVDGGSYRLNFATGPYYKAQGVDTFFPEIDLSFTVSDAGEHYHVPLLLSPFAFSTYRGS